MSTQAGVGHIPSQSIEYVYNFTHEQMLYATDALNYQEVQNRLPVSSPPRFQSRYNGFFFGFRRPDIFKAEFAPSQLFNPKNRIVGQEDDLTRRLRRAGIQIMLVTNAFIYHWKGVTVKKSFFIPELGLDGRENLALYHAGLEKPAVRPVIAFAISDPDKNHLAGDLYTAFELAAALRKLLGWETRFLSRDKLWYNTSGVDVLVVMFDAYDLTRLPTPRPIVIAWIRDWFQRWISWPWFPDYNLILASSTHAVEYLKKIISNKHVEVFRLATNPRTFLRGKYDPVFAVDYVFTANYRNASPVLMSFTPETVSYVGALYGRGWNETRANVCRIWRGQLPSSRMPDVYASTRLVIDDANNLTIGWGSVNSRVFDALGAGTLVLTSGVLGAEEVFGELLPTFRTEKQLVEALTGWLKEGNAGLRSHRVQKLQALTLASHTYANRAFEFYRYLTRFLHCGTRAARELCHPFSQLRFLPHTNGVYRVCVLVRTYPKQEHQLIALLYSLLSTRTSSISLSVYLLNTHSGGVRDDSWMVPIIELLNRQFADAPVSIWSHNLTAISGFYGYDVTDAALAAVLADGCCTYLLITNGDNLYSVDLFSAVEPWITRQYDMIAWDFISHHPRNGTSNLKIEVQLKRQHVDLGAVLFRADFVQAAGAKFLPQGPQTSDLFARDWWFVDMLLQSSVHPTIHLLHRVLFFHQ